MENNKAVLFELNIENDRCIFPNTISDAIIDANKELKDLEDKLNETLETIRLLTPECDKLDYILSVSSGALCGIMDVFLVGKPGESPLGDITDKWFANRTIDFAKICGYTGDKNSLSSAIKFLEKKFKIPYDQSVGGGIFRELIDLTPSNHHFKSLGHNPTLLGLFFSILNQFTNTSDFVSNGELISLNNSDGKFELQGKNIPSKLFCGIANWIGHLISDVAGSSSSKGRGMGIPSPIWAWSNDVIAIKAKLNIPVTEFDKSVNELALKLFEKGYDVRFQTTQAIPVFINEMVVRLLYSIRRLIGYYISIPKKDRSWGLLWKSCEPFSNATVKRMLTVAHGTFCMGIATTFGVASTGTAISTLSGAAATNAALAWLGGGALAAGGGGMAAGEAFLTLAGPAGWAIAGVALVASGIMFWRSSGKKKRIEEIFTLIRKRDVKSYKLAVVELSERITRIDEESKLLRDAIVKVKSFGTDYDAMTEAQQYELGVYVNLMLSSTQLLVNPILGLQTKYGNEDFEKFVSWKGRKADKALCNDFKTLIISFANLLYKIDLDDNDKRLLYKTFKGNKKMLSALNMKKKKFKIEILNAVEEALLYSYK